jgi:hypothetical protein
MCDLRKNNAQMFGGMKYFVKHTHTHTHTQARRARVN